MRLLFELQLQLTVAVAATLHPLLQLQTDDKEAREGETIVALVGLQLER